MLCFKALMFCALFDCLFFHTGTLSPFWNILLWVALGVFTALLPVLPKPIGIGFFLVSLILRAIYTMGLGPALLLLGAVNVSEQRLVFEECVCSCLFTRTSFFVFIPFSAFQQVGVSCKFCGEPRDVHSRLQSSRDGHALYLPFVVCHHLRLGPLCS